MKYLIIAGVFVLGLSLGYIIGTQNSSGENLNGKSIADNSDSSDQEHTSNNNSNHHNNDSEDENSENEEEELLLEDSLNADFLMNDSLNSEDHISTEKMIRSVQFPIVYLADEQPTDTAMAELLGIEDVQSKSMFVEFWESPLNFEGYKLSKKKLVVYGLSPQFDYKVYKEGTNYYLSYQNVYYKMKETQDFLPFTEVAKSEVFND
jgi:hypothetical protein